MAWKDVWAYVHCPSYRKWSNMGNDKMLIIIVFGYKTDILDVNTPTLTGELKELCSSLAQKYYYWE